MAAEADVDFEPRMFFTAPWEPVLVRRGDALGLRALADQLAEAVAPDLSNRVNDGRWVTILAWCLVRSQEVFHASGGNSVSTREEQRKRYAWLRPPELMWVTRTIALATDWKDRSLAGQRSVMPWYEESGEPARRFGMTADQFRSYRQTGMYGGYRLAFRKWPGLTRQGDGWTPGPESAKLADWLDKRLGSARPSWPLHSSDGVSKQSAKLGQGAEHSWWLGKWNTYDHCGRKADANTLPRRKDDFAALPEADLLMPLIFGETTAGKRRRQVAREVKKSKAANHIEVCEHLAGAFKGVPEIAQIPRFSRLADAGMAAMDLMAGALYKDSRTTLAKVAALPTAGSICSELRAAATEWLKKPDAQIRHVETANRFAGAITTAAANECLKEVLYHHELYGGGLRWFVLRDGRIEPRTPPRSGTSRYRFRLWQLCRLAAQCGLQSGMPAGLENDTAVEEDELEEASGE